LIGRGCNRLIGRRQSVGKVTPGSPWRKFNLVENSIRQKIYFGRQPDL
jgi:hypothetical protein